LIGNVRHPGSDMSGADYADGLVPYGKFFPFSKREDSGKNIFRNGLCIASTRRGKRDAMRFQVNLIHMFGTGRCRGDKSDMRFFKERAVHADCRSAEKNIRSTRLPTDFVKRVAAEENDVSKMCARFGNVWYVFIREDDHGAHRF